jgi:hypothetical protein
MPQYLLDTALAVALPCCLFISSLWRIQDAARRAKPGDLSHAMWVGIFVMVNVVACVWSAVMLDSVRTEGQVTAEQSATTYSSGLYLFTTLALVVFAGPVAALARSLMQRLRARNSAQ